MHSCDWEKSPAGTELSSTQLTCTEVTVCFEERVREEGEGGAGQPQSLGTENYKKQEAGFGPNSSGFANWCSPKSGSYPPTEAGRQGPYLQMLAEETVNSLGSLEFSQADTFMEAGVSLGISLKLLETMFVFVQVSIVEGPA